MTWLSRRDSKRPGADRSAPPRNAPRPATLERQSSSVHAGRLRSPPQPSRVRGVEVPERIGGNRFGVSDVAGGCLLAVGSTAVSCSLLVINGALVMAVLAALSASGVEWVRNDQASQFMLFSIPVALLIVQWMMIDYVRHVLRKSRL